MKNTFLICFLLFTSIAFSQDSLDSKITGNWKVKKVVQATNNSNTKDLIDGFAGATFNFDKDHTFTLTTSNNSKLFEMLANMTNGKKWLIKPNSIIAIGSKSDNYNIMKIKYKSENGTVTFTLYETDIELEVEKI